MLVRAQMTALIALATHDSEQTPLIVRDNPDPKGTRGLRQHTTRMHSPPVAEDEETTGENEDETNRVIPVYCSHNLDERDFGTLQGMHSRMQRRMFRPEQLEAWRCNWQDRFPGGESSEDVYNRVVSFFEKHIRNQLEQGNNVMIVAHGFVQRVLIKYLINMKDSDWVTHMKLESHPNVENRKSSKLLAQNAVPVIFSYAQGPHSAIVRVDTLISAFQEVFGVEEEGMYLEDGKTKKDDEVKKDEEAKQDGKKKSKL